MINPIESKKERKSESLGKRPTRTTAATLLPLLPILLPLLALTGCDDGPAASKVPATKAEQAPKGLLATVSAWGSSTKDVVDPSEMLKNNWYYVLDGSGSMASSDCSSNRRGGRMTDAKEASIRFERMIPREDNLALFVFDENGTGERVPLGSGPRNRAAFEAAIDAVVAGNSTPLGESIEQGYAALEAQARRQGGYGSYHLVVETDGFPNRMDVLQDAVAHVVKTPVILETIGFCIAAGHPLNKPGFTEYHNAMTPEDLDKGLEAIIAETDAFDKSDDKRKDLAR